MAATVAAGPPADRAMADAAPDVVEPTIRARAEQPP
jgi:hypothetical protein